MSDHAPFRELCALRLYGELDPDDEARLDAHLAGCAACRAFAAELAQGLGRLAPAAADDLPAGWRAELAELAALAPATGRAPAARARRRARLAFAAGLAAGLLLMALAQGLRPAPPGAPSAPAAALRVATNATAEPAPLASGEAEPPRAPAHGYAGLGLYLQAR